MSVLNRPPAPSCSGLHALADQTQRLFLSRYGRPPQWLAAAPGRVNLIGEHTDYNGGYVLPMAIDRYTAIAAGERLAVAGAEAAVAEIYSADVGEAARIRLREPLQPGDIPWARYVEGVVAGCAQLGWEIPPFEAVIHSSVPLGGGLSSSAALEVATATLLEAICQRTLDPVEKALLCQRAEHAYAGMPCGIMDQFSSVLGREDMLMLLDCRSQEVQHVPLADPDVAVVIANTNVKHELTGGEYAQRRRECEIAHAALGVSLLRDASSADLDAAQDRLDPVVFRRARHVISEISRTMAAAEALARADWPTVGELMYASHASLRQDYEVSCAELDLLVDMAHSLGASGGVIGSRMTGGGFGGCTVSLVRSVAVPAFMSELARRYREATAIEATLFSTRPAQGAMILPV